MMEGESHSERFKPQMDSEAARTDVSNLDEDVTHSLNTHDAREENSDGSEPIDWNLLPQSSQEGIQKLAGSSKNTEGLSRDSESPTKVECPAVNQGHPFCFSDSSNAWVVEDTKEGGNQEDGTAVSSDTSADNLVKEHGSGVCREGLNDSGKIESMCLEEKDGFGREVERLNESLTAIMPLCISSDNCTESSSNDDKQRALFSTANGNGELKNEATDELGRDLQALPSLTSTGKIEAHVFQNEQYQSFDMSKQEWSDQGSVVTSLISADIEGWHRFDAEEVITNMDHTHGTEQRLELWEKLLDDGLDGSERDTQTSPLQLALAPSPFEDKQFGLASPGNPFIEGLDRVSSFSEADGFVRNGDLRSSARLSQSFEESSSLRWEQPFHAVRGNDDFLSGMVSLDGEKNAVQLESINERGSTLHQQLPPSKRPLSSFDSMEPFEAPSFMSLVDPKSQAIFEASMPTYQASSAGYGQRNGGEKWVATFDVMAPSMQEITRSLSLPRSGSEARDQRLGQSFSFATDRGEEPSKGESQSPHPPKSGLPPKLSPLVQKVVDKVRTTPAVANGVLNTVRQAMSPKVSDKKSTSRSLLARCICW